jgi:hypothetical protein
MAIARPKFKLVSPMVMVMIADVYIIFMISSKIPQSTACTIVKLGPWGPCIMEISQPSRAQKSPVPTKKIKPSVVMSLPDTSGAYPLPSLHQTVLHVPPGSSARFRIAAGAVSVRGTALRASPEWFEVRRSFFFFFFFWLWHISLLIMSRLSVVALVSHVAHTHTRGTHTRMRCVLLTLHVPYVTSCINACLYIFTLTCFFVCGGRSHLIVIDWFEPVFFFFFFFFFFFKNGCC